MIFDIQRFAVSMQLRDGSTKGVVTTDDIDTLNYGGGGLSLDIELRNPKAILM